VRVVASQVLQIVLASFGADLGRIHVVYVLQRQSVEIKDKN
jgi:hypothetical protein